MPFSFVLPTTSALSYQSFLRSGTHPSLPLSATTYRNILRGALKKHRRLSAQSKSQHLHTIVSAIGEYVPYLFALDAGLSGKTIADEEVEILLNREIEVEWRTIITKTATGREPPRVKGKGLDCEICYVLTTLACTYTLLARAQLYGLYESSTPQTEQRVKIVSTAINHLLQASSIHKYLASRLDGYANPDRSVVESRLEIQNALAEIAFGEATLVGVLKDDLYPAIVAQNRNRNDKEWMIKAPEIPKTRSHFLARLCLASADHTTKAEALFGVGENSAKEAKTDESIMKYTTNLKRAARARACRFFGINAELAGETGEGIAWLMGAGNELGIGGIGDSGSSRKGFAKLKKDWAERKEDQNILKGGDWGSDAGRFEEGRVIEMLESKWTKTNNLVGLSHMVKKWKLTILQIGAQSIPPFAPLVASMPSGREMHISKPYTPPSLDEDVLANMRAPPDRDSFGSQGSDRSSTEAEDSTSAGVPGAFPGVTSPGEGERPFY